MISFSCHINGKELDNKSYDNTLVGFWSGHSASDDGYYKNWIHRKKKDGTYQTSFFYYRNQGLYEGFEKVTGRWWVSEGTLYQFESWMNKPLTYKYEKLDNSCIEYTLISLATRADVSIGYSFTECEYEN